MRKGRILIISLIIVLIVFRIFVGIQINFSHKDYTQIYLIGLENSESGEWSYWGPDIVWSKTRLPGAMQGLLAGVPIRLTKNIYSPLILSNLIAALGLILLSFYAKKRFPKLPLPFLIILFLTFQFGLLNAAVLLNTAYLIFSGAILFFAVFELFIYREQLLLKKPAFYFFLIGFALMFTYQLHLTWVMILPFIVVLSFLEWKRNFRQWWLPISYITFGALISSLTFIPTLLSFPEAIFNNMGGNLVIEPSRAARVPELFIRYLGMATFDIDFKKNVIELACTNSKLVYSLLWVMEILNYALMAAIIIVPFFIKKTLAFKKTLLLFALTLIMALFLFTLSNKHLSTRTYILLYPIPLWISLYVYNFLIKFKYAKHLMYSIFITAFLTFLGVGMANYNKEYSFHPRKESIKKAIKTGDTEEFAKRRWSVMDTYR